MRFGKYIHTCNIYYIKIQSISGILEAEAGRFRVLATSLDLKNRNIDIEQNPFNAVLSLLTANLGMLSFMVVWVFF